MNTDRPSLQARIDEMGMGVISINGVDISNACTGFKIFAQIAKPTQIQVNLLGTQLDLDIEGMLETMQETETQDPQTQPQSPQEAPQQPMEPQPGEPTPPEQQPAQNPPQTNDPQQPEPVQQ